MDFNIGRGRYWPKYEDLLSSKENILGVTTSTPTEKEINMCQHVTCSLAHE